MSNDFTVKTWFPRRVWEVTGKKPDGTPLWSSRPVTIDDRRARAKIAQSFGMHPDLARAMAGISAKQPTGNRTRSGRELTEKERNELLKFLAKQIEEDGE